MSKTKRGLSLLTVLGFLVVLGCTPTKPKYDPQAEQERRDRIRQQIADSAKADYAIRAPVPVREKPEPEPDKPDLELLSSNGVTEEYATRIKGIIRNNTHKSYSLVRVSFDVFDEQGNRIGTATDVITGLDREQTWKYEAIYIGDGGSRFRLDAVSGF